MVQIEREYAEALFSVALEENAVREYLDAVKTVRQVLDENPDYVDFLASPAMSMAERKTALEEAFSAMPEYVVSFLGLLCENARIRSVFGCIEEFERLAAVSLNMTSATIYSAIALSDEQKKKICEKTEKRTGKTIIPTYIIDESLIGGIRMEVDSVTLDGSIRHSLNEIKDVMNS